MGPTCGKLAGLPAHTSEVSGHTARGGVAEGEGKGKQGGLKAHSRLMGFAQKHRNVGIQILCLGPPSAGEGSFLQLRL